MLGFMVNGATARFPQGNEVYLKTACRIRTPSEILVQDILVREDMFPNATPRVGVFHDLNGERFGDPNRDHDQLAMRENMIYLGRGPHVLSTPDIPRYPEMVRAAMARVG